MSTGKLQLANGYPADMDVMARVLHCVASDNRPRWTLTDIGDAAGLARRQVENTASLARAFGLTAAVTMRPTPLGRSVHRHDPFFDDLGTLWLLHYIISSEPRHIVWHCVTNDLLPRGRPFARDDVRAALAHLAASHSPRSVQKHLREEVNTALGAYTQQSFRHLAYIVEHGERFALGYREPVPPLVLAACIARFRVQHRPGETAIPVCDLIAAPNSPGVVCQIPEDRLRAGLEVLKAQPGLSLESRADLDQVRLTDNTQDHEWMERYYASR